MEKGNKLFKVVVVFKYTDEARQFKRRLNLEAPNHGLAAEQGIEYVRCSNIKIVVVKVSELEITEVPPAKKIDLKDVL